MERFTTTRLLRVTAAALSVSIVASGCASARPGRMSPSTSARRTVDPVADNAAVVKQLSPALIVTVAIDNGVVKLVDAHVAHVPQRSARPPTGDRVRVTALRGGSEVSKIEVDDPVNVQEGVGLVRPKQREIVAALPMPGRFEKIRVEVLSPGTKVTSSEFSVKRSVERYCSEHRSERSCSE